MTQEEAERAIAEFNKRISPVENAFMVYVDAYKLLGYGRMIQMIQAKWECELSTPRRAVDANSSRDVP